MKQNTISTKIKFIGILFIVLMTSIIVTTMYLNEKNKKDASIINIAGKQRMLTQNISKNVFNKLTNKQQKETEERKQREIEAMKQWKKNEEKRAELREKLKRLI